MSGASMEPSLYDGDLVVGWRWFSPRVDQIVVLSASKQKIIKRIKWQNSETIWLEGDNTTASTDSRTKGPFQAAQLEAKIIAKIRSSKKLRSESEK
ncbi:MAG: S26 family signal peptidase [Candidatus Saccharimonadia bacterium]